MYFVKPLSMARLPASETDVGVAEIGLAGAEVDDVDALRRSAPARGSAPPASARPRSRSDAAREADRRSRAWASRSGRQRLPSCETRCASVFAQRRARRRGARAAATTSRTISIRTSRDTPRSSPRATTASTNCTSQKTKRISASWKRSSQVQQQQKSEEALQDREEDLVRAGCASKTQRLHLPGADHEDDRDHRREDRSTG